MRQVVRRDGDRDAITGNDLDVKPAEPTADASEKRMPLIPLHSKMPAGEGLDHSPLNLNQIISCHRTPFRVVRVHQFHD